VIAPVNAPVNRPSIAPILKQKNTPFQLTLNAPVIAPINAPNPNPKPAPKILLFKYSSLFSDMISLFFIKWFRMYFNSTTYNPGENSVN
jgi:hypothetical protein